MTRRVGLTPYFFLAPALLAIAVFVLYPILAVIYYSFTDYSIITPPVWVGLRNYQELLTDSMFWTSVRNSFLYLIVTPVIIILSVMLAIAVNRKIPFINTFRALYYVPVVVGSIAVGICWRQVFAQSGVGARGLLYQSAQPARVCEDREHLSFHSGFV